MLRYAYIYDKNIQQDICDKQKFQVINWRDGGAIIIKDLFNVLFFKWGSFYKCGIIL